MTPQEAADILKNSKARIPIDLWDAVDALSVSDRPKFQFFAFRYNLTLDVDQYDQYLGIYEAHEGVPCEWIHPGMYSVHDPSWVRSNLPALKSFATLRLGRDWANRAEIRRLTMEVTNNELVPNTKK